MKIQLCLYSAYNKLIKHRFTIRQNTVFHTLYSMLSKYEYLLLLDFLTQTVNHHIQCKKQSGIKINVSSFSITLSNHGVSCQMNHQLFAILDNLIEAL